MGRYVYRCGHCRTQHRFLKPVQTYVRQKTCRACRNLTRHRNPALRVTGPRRYVDKQVVSAPTCRCEGYHFPHRPGSRCCELHPLYELHRRVRAGEESLEVLAELAWEGRLPYRQSEEPCF